MALSTQSDEVPVSIVSDEKLYPITSVSPDRASSNASCRSSTGSRKVRSATCAASSRNALQIEKSDSNPTLTSATEGATSIKMSAASSSAASVCAMPPTRNVPSVIISCRTAALGAIRRSVLCPLSRRVASSPIKPRTPHALIPERTGAFFNLTRPELVEARAYSSASSTGKISWLSTTSSSGSSCSLVLCKPRA